MDPINIAPINVSINIPAPWIRHGICTKYFQLSRSGSIQESEPLRPIPVTCAYCEEQEFRRDDA